METQAIFFQWLLRSLHSKMQLRRKACLLVLCVNAAVFCKITRLCCCNSVQGGIPNFTGFFSLVLWPFLYLFYWLPGDGVSSFCFLPASPSSSLCISPLFEPGVLWPHQALQCADAVQDCCCLKQSFYIVLFHFILMYI